MNTVSTQEIVPIALDAIEVGERLRPVDHDHVALIAQSVREQGVRHPIEVRALADGRYGLISGAHRLAAARLLDWQAIPAVVKDADELMRELLEVDENLCRFDLNALDKAVFLARRKELYQQLHPTTKRGGDRRSAAKAIKDAICVFDRTSFAKDVAKRVGLSPQHVNKHIRRATIVPQLREAVAGTRIARRGCDLDALAALDADGQRAVARLLGERVWATKPVKQVIETALGRPPAERKSPVEALLARFARLSAPEQAAFLKAARGIKAAGGGAP